MTGDKPGVTRGRQWIKINDNFEVLDMPGILWHKFDDEAVGVKLAVTGAVADNIHDTITLCEELLAILSELGAAENSFIPRYKLTDCKNQTPRAILEMIAKARGFIMKGGELNLDRAAMTVLDEFRGGRLGRVSLEKPK